MYCMVLRLWLCYCVVVRLYYFVVGFMSAFAVVWSCGGGVVLCLCDGAIVWACGYVVVRLCDCDTACVCG